MGNQVPTFAPFNQTKMRIFLLPFFLLTVNLTFGQQLRENLVITQMRADVTYLSSDKLEGRATGSKGEELAALYLSEQFSMAGVKPAGSDGYWQHFGRKREANPHSTQPVDTSMIYAKNVIGFIDNGALTTVIIGAHYDHLGWGESGGSMHTGEPEIHNGADDNASGVAMMLDIAKWVKENELSGNNYMFIAFSGEELGLWGSTYFMQHPTIANLDINYMINLDMVGRLNNENTLAVNGVGTSPAWKRNLKKVNKDQLNYVFSQSGIGPSDHTQFYLKDIPVLHFFTGQHDDYHRPSDDVEKVNFQGMVSISSLIKQLVKRLDDDGKLKFKKTKDEDSNKAPAFSVTLGVVPDYLFDGKGMRISGVKEDRPAIKAGMKEGDIVVKMGSVEVDDMMSYMKGLAEFEKGDKADVTLLRDGKKIEVMVVF